MKIIIKNQDILSCNKCNKEYNNLQFYSKTFITISSDELDYNDISSIFIDKKYTEANECCQNCANTKFKIKTCSVKYNNNHEYSLMSGICFKNENHFTITFHKISQNLPDYSL